VQRITSPQNPRIKAVLKLQKRSARDQARHTVVEGWREASRALANHVIPSELYLCPELMQPADLAYLQSLLPTLAAQNTALYELPPGLFAKLAYREGSDGILLVIPYLARTLEHLPLGRPPFLCVIEGVEKPGNLGAILRTADAAGVDGVIVCAGATDLHNPNVVRASLGTLFTVPVVEATTTEILSWLHENSIIPVAATPHASQRYTAIDLTGPVAVVMGSEAKGLSDAWLVSHIQQVSIPMLGTADSLNLATATALMLYEVVRQRQPH
jgi:TrmH family RNA methyltransferase